MNGQGVHRVSASGPILTALGVTVFLSSCGAEPGIVGPDQILPQLAKPDCSADSSHPSCGGSGPEPSGTLTATGGMSFSDASAIIETDNETRLNTFVDGDVSIHYTLATTSAAIVSGTCNIVHGNRVSDAEAQTIANALAGEIDDDLQVASRFASGIRYEEASGGINTKFDLALGPVRVRLTDASNFPENGTPTANLVSDDGTTTVVEYTGGTLLVWLNLKKQDAVQVGCPNGETVRVTLTR